MALGAALANGKPQALSIVPGPVFLNGCAALATAYALNAPVAAERVCCMKSKDSWRPCAR